MQIMRDLYYENQGNNTYLVYEIRPEDSVDTMSLGMLTNNRIHGLAQTQFTQMDDKKFIKFNVSSKVSVAQFFTGIVNRKRLLGVFMGIVNAMLAAEDYMLDPASIILDMDYIFTDVSTCETELICLPVVDSQMEQPALGMFFRNIIFNTQFDQSENCDHVAKIINYLNGTPAFSLTEFKTLLESMQEQKSQPVQTPPAVTVQPSKQPVVPPVQPVQEPKATVPPVTNVNVPPVQKSVPPQSVPKPAAAPESSGPEISFFYLMQHYNKDNAAAYKAQKKAKKMAAAAGKEKKKSKQPREKAPQPAAPANEFGFAVPGRAAPIAQATPAAQMPPQPVAAPVPQPVAQPVVPQAPAQQPAYVPRQTFGGQAANFGETTVLAGGTIGETTVLTAANNPAQLVVPHLIRKKNNENISLNKPVFRVGKERSYVDYFIGDNTAISRSHANFITRDGKYFVVDTNSTNHTFVNGVMIQSNVETEISQGDMIRLANEEFEFKLY